MPTTITRSFEFDLAHRVLGHAGKCQHIHGHRYTAEVTVSAPLLNELGMVIDFAAMKGKIGAWIDSNWDHNIILHPEDPILLILVQSGERLPATLEHPDTISVGECNPTAENMARFLFRKAQELLRPDAIIVVQVRLYETPNCYADYVEGNQA